MAFPVISSSASYQSPVTTTPTIPNYGSVDGALILHILTCSSSATTVTDALNAAYSSGGYTLLSSATGGPAYSAVYAKVYNASSPGTSVTFNAGTNVNVGVTQVQITGWYGSIAGLAAISTTAPGTDAFINPLPITAGWGSADNLWIAVAMRTNTLANNTISGNPTGYTSLLTHGPSVTTGASQWAYYKSTAPLETEDPSNFTWSNARTSSAFTIAVRPAAGRYLRVSLHESASGAAGFSGVVFQSPSGSDITGAKIGEFTGQSFQSTLVNGLAVLDAPLDSFGGEALAVTDTPVVLVRNEFDTSGIVTASIIEA
jgi:hypothetical protein